MDTVKSSPLAAFKSKKPLHSPAPSDQKARKVSGHDPDTFSVTTPGKPVDPPRRSSRRRTAVMSVNEIRQAALKLRERGSGSSARPDEVAGSTSEPIVKSRKKSVDSEIKLPEKYELLDRFFNSLESSIRLLQLKGSTTSFTNISMQIECLTDRRFSHSHLAQLKFVVPEAIVIEKILQHDERTSCMKPDLLITLNTEAYERENKSKSQSKYLLLRKVFRGRLLEFFKSHPEGEDVPEEALPAPFNRLKEDASGNSGRVSTSSLINDTPHVALPGRVVATSHLSPSFRKSFSQRDSGNHSGNITQAHSVIADTASVTSETKLAGNPFKKQTGAIASKSLAQLLPTPSCKASSSDIPSFPLLETPVKSTSSTSNDEDRSSSETMLRTPAESASTPAKLMSATPMLRPPKRSHMSPDDNSFSSPSKLIKRPPPKRPLKFDTPVKKVKVDEFGRGGSSSADDDILDILPAALLKSIREKEEKALMELDPAISQAKKRRQMIASLPKFFDMIYFFFQSIKRSVVTKEELTHKLISGNLQIVDKREVEEQLRLLQELAPEWIYEKPGLNGDLLLCVNKISSPEMIRRRIDEAK